MFDPEGIRNDGGEAQRPDEIHEENLPMEESAAEPAEVVTAEPVEETMEESAAEPAAEEPAAEPAEEPVTGELTPAEAPEEPKPQGPEPGSYAWFQVEKYKKSLSNRENMASALSGRGLKLYAILSSVKMGWTLLLSLISLFLLPILLMSAASGNMESSGIEIGSGMDLFAIADLILVWMLVAHLGKNGGKNLMGDIKGLRIVRAIQMVMHAIGTVIVVLLLGVVSLMLLFADLPMDEIVREIGPQFGGLVAGLIGILPILMAVVSISMVLGWIYYFCLYRYLGDNIKFLEGEAVAVRTGYLRFWQVMRILGQTAGIVAALIMAGFSMLIPELLGIGTQGSNGIGTMLIVVVPILLSIFGSALEIALCVLRLRLFAKGEKVIRSN
ncbi:MAG: hypothetical protein IKZ21_03690 [Clostridia bacterium]|nr:hypothetical protein [Clostridia bacterium]